MIKYFIFFLLLVVLIFTISSTMAASDNSASNSKSIKNFIDNIINNIKGSIQGSFISNLFDNDGVKNDNVFVPLATETFPNEPAGFTTIVDTDWETAPLGRWNDGDLFGWRGAFRDGTKTIGFETISDSRLGENRALAWTIPASHEGGGGAEVKTADSFSYTKIYTGMYWKVSSNWYGHKSSIFKLIHLRSTGETPGDMWLEANSIGDQTNLINRVINQFPNTVPFSGGWSSGSTTRGNWHLIESVIDMTSRTLTVWVDGTLMPSFSWTNNAGAPTAIEGIWIAGMLGGIGATGNPSEQKFLVDRARVSYSGGSTPPSTPAPIVTLTASPTSINAGQSSTLTWSSTGATSCTASGGMFTGTKALSSSQSVSPTASTTYTLTCTGSGGSTSKSTTVTVPTQQTANCPTTVPANTFQACYYDNKDFTSLKLIKTDSTINFDWGSGSPDSTIGVDTFSAKWEGDFIFESATYNFTATADDGIRVYIDNQILIDQWKDQAPTTYQASKTLTAGTHRIKVEYYENGIGATAKVSWIKQTTSPPPVNSGGTILFSDDFESGNLNKYTLRSDHREISSVRTHSGNYAVRSNGEGELNVPITPVQELWIRSWHYFDTNVQSTASGHGTRPIILDSAGNWALRENVNLVGEGSIQLENNPGGTGGADGYGAVASSAYVNGYNWYNNRGNWFCLEQHAKLNDPGQANGVSEIYVNGNRIGGITGNFRGTYPLNWNAIDVQSWSTNQGSGYWYVDDVVVSTQRVGCEGTEPPPSTTDTTPPIVTINSPTVNQQLNAGTISTTLSVTTNEAATCRYSNSNQAYDNMANTFTTTGSTAHTIILTGLANGQSYTYYVRCADASGNKNTASSTIIFSVASVVPVCGDNICNGNENSASCPVDCSLICDITSASWSKNNSVEGDVVYLNVFGNNCNGKTVSFDVKEKDFASDLLGGDDPINANPLNVVFNGASASGTWVSEWQDDGLAGTAGDPEYYFTATVVGTNEQMQSGTNDFEMLHVTQKKSLPSNPGTPQFSVVSQNSDGTNVLVKWDASANATSYRYASGFNSPINTSAIPEPEPMPTPTPIVPPPAPSSGNYPNQPAGFSPWLEHDFQTLPNNTPASHTGRFITMRGGTGNYEIVTDTSTPSPRGGSKVLRIKFPKGMVSGVDPGAFFGHNNANPSTPLDEWYTSFWVKFDGSDWEWPPAAQKLWYTSIGNRELPSYGGTLMLSTGNSKSSINPGPVYTWVTTRKTTGVVADQWYGGTPGISTDGKWHHIEFYGKRSTPDVADGRRKVWIDGIKTLDVAVQDQSFTNNWLTGFFEFHFSPVWGGVCDPDCPKTRDDFMRIAHLYISGKPVFGATLPPPPAQPTVTCPTTVPSGTFQACYYDNKDFTSLKLTKTESTINFDWGSGSPDSTIGVDTFSAKWEGDFTFENAIYNFSAIVDDGVRLYIDNNILIDKWLDQAPTTYTATKAMTPGAHRVKVEYYENGIGATAKVSWAKGQTAQPLPPPPPPTTISWPNEPVGFTTIADTNWETAQIGTWTGGTVDGWTQKFASSARSLAFESISDGLLDESRALAFIYPPQHMGGGGVEISRGFSPYKKIYVAMYFKVSSNFYGHPSSIHKLFYIEGSDPSSDMMWYEANGIGDSAHRYTEIVNQLAGRAGDARVGNGAITRGDWHLIETVLDMTTNPRGSTTVWVDGVQKINYVGIGGPTDIVGVTLSGIMGGIGATSNPSEQKFLVDRVRVSYSGGSGTTTPPPTVSLSANPTSINAGQSSTLTWSSTGATSCTASGGMFTGTKALSSSQSVSPTASTTYTLTCTGSGGSTSKSTMVTINQQMSPPSLISRPNEPSGFTRIAENDFSALPVATTGAMQPGGLAGVWRIYNPGGNYVASNGVMRIRFPSGLPAGSGPGSFSVWNTNDAQEFSQFYEYGRARVVGNSMETPSPGFKMLGYWGVADKISGGGNPTQLYNSMNGANGLQGTYSSWSVAMYSQTNRAGDSISWSKGSGGVIRANEWFDYEIFRKLNDIGQNNGVLKIWINGALVLNDNAVQYRSATNPSGFWGRRFDPIWGGGGTPKTRDDYTEFDHMYISGVPMSGSGSTLISAPSSSSSQISITGLAIENSWNGQSNVTSDTSVILPNVPNNSSIFFCVWGVNSVGESVDNACNSYVVGSTQPPSGDTTPPIATIISPIENQQLAIGTTQTTLSVTTNEAATCKYDAIDRDFNAMIYTLNGAGTTSHTTAITNLQNGTNYIKYARCQDASGNKNTASSTISFTVAGLIPVCGDGICNGNENSQSCVRDCSASVCGDNICNATETINSCSVDCPLFCDLTSASWSTNKSVEGEIVYFDVTGNNCNLKTVSFEVKEYDILGNDRVKTNPLNLIFQGNSVKGSWIAEWQSEGAGESEPPEYYFTASVVGGNEQISSRTGASELLSVNKLGSEITQVPTSSGGGGGGGRIIPGLSTKESIRPSITQTRNLQKASLETINIVKDFGQEIGIKQIEINVVNEAQNVDITVSKYDSRPATVSVQKSGKTYKYLQIETENIGANLESAKITFQVEKRWAEENNLKKENIALFKFLTNENRWGQLLTTFTEEDNLFYYYKTELNSFSYFVIGEKEMYLEQPSETAIDSETQNALKDILLKKITKLVIVLLILIIIVVISLIFIIRSRRAAEFRQRRLREELR